MASEGALGAVFLGDWERVCEPDRRIAGSGQTYVRSANKSKNSRRNRGQAIEFWLPVSFALAKLHLIASMPTVCNKKSSGEWQRVVNRMRCALGSKKPGIEALANSLISSEGAVE